MRIKKLEEVYCFHRNLITAGGLLGCPDCGAGDSAIRKNLKTIPKKSDPIVSKLNEVIDFINLTTPTRGDKE